ncbi:MAG: ATP-binding protein [Chloroflexi bacterium]|jgi:signal transduction histidine kinase|nr:ATP-binding protein [Chloroflexota bacterium]
MDIPPGGRGDGDPLAAAAPRGLVIADDLAEGVLAVDPGNTIVFANAAAHRILERRPASLPGGSAMEAFIDHRAEDLVVAARRQGSAAGDLPPRISDGRWLGLRARRSADGIVWIVVEDVTELRRLQRIRAEFLDNLSHELRTPVTNVNLLLEMLMRDAEALPPRTRERLERLQVEAAQLAQMVSELLDLASIEGGQPLLLADVDLADLSREQAERLRVYAERNGVAIVVEAPETGPIVRGDATRLGQAILNLVHNAVKFSEPGDTVTVRVDASAEAATVVVADEGAGIPRADRDRVFERFYKVDRARRRGQGGTGLGLSIVRHVVHAHGGTIRVESEEGVGSTFTVALPIAAPAAGGSAP